MPHCAPPHSKKEAWRAINCGPWAMPSMVVRFVPAACRAGMRQLFTNSPFIKTEQEPHSPSPQPSFVPVNPSSPRRTSSSLSMGKTRTVSGFPFTVRESSHLPRSSLPRYSRMAHRSPPAQTASKISSGKSGTESKRVPSASSIALTIAGAGPSIGSSPIPFAPYAP